MSILTLGFRFLLSWPHVQPIIRIYMSRTSSQGQAIETRYLQTNLTNPTYSQSHTLLYIQLTLKKNLKKKKKKKKQQQQQQQNFLIFFNLWNFFLRNIRNIISLNYYNLIIFFWVSLSHGLVSILTLGLILFLILASRTTHYQNLYVICHVPHIRFRQENLVICKLKVLIKD